MLLDKQDSLRLSTGVYEPVETILIKHLLKSDWICLDIGAHVGYFTILMAKLCKQVYAFEPDPNNFEILQENIKLEKLEDKVDAFQDVINETDFDMPLYQCKANSGMHRIYKSKWCDSEPIGVRGFRIDSWFEECLPIHLSVHFVKMDIEGAELGALKGMKATLENNHPIMIMEFHPPSIEEYGANPREEYDFLKALGYSIRLIPKISIPISFEELDKETRKESGRNLLCLPPNHSL